MESPRRPSFLSGIIKRRGSSAADDPLMNKSIPMEVPGRRQRSSSLTQSLKLKSLSPKRSIECDERAHTTPISAESVAQAQRELSEFASNKGNIKAPTPTPITLGPLPMNVALAKFIDRHHLKSPQNLELFAGTASSARRLCSNTIDISLSSYNEHIYVPSNISSSTNYNDDAETEAPEEDIERVSSPSPESTRFHICSPLYLNSQVETDSPVVHGFVVIVTVKSATTVDSLTVLLNTAAKTLWPQGMPYNKSKLIDYTRIGACEWRMKLADHDCFIGEDGETVPGEGNQRELMKYRLMGPKDVTKDETDTSFPRENVIASTNEDSQTKQGIYIFLLPILFPATLPETSYSPNGALNHTLNVAVLTIVSDKARAYHARCHIPVVKLPPSQSISTLNKPVYVNKVWNDSLNYEISFPNKYISLGSTDTVLNIKLIPLVKKLVIKRVRVNITEKISYFALYKGEHYEYEQGTETFPDYTIPAKQKYKDRVVSLYEVRTTPGGDKRGLKKSKKKAKKPAMSEEVVSCFNDNLLSLCFDGGTESVPVHDLPSSRKGKPKAPESEVATFNHLGKNRGSQDVIISEPISIDIPLSFGVEAVEEDLPEKTRHVLGSSNSLEIKRNPSATFTTQANRSRANSVNDLAPPPSLPSTNGRHLGHFKRILHRHHEPDSADSLAALTSSAEMTKAREDYVLYPDTNSKFMKISHRIQIAFRISKLQKQLNPFWSDSLSTSADVPKHIEKLHHYEVMIDSPIVILSKDCPLEATTLPQYLESGFDLTATDTASSSSSSTGGVRFKEPDYQSVPTCDSDSFSSVSAPLAKPKMAIRHFDPEVYIPPLGEELPTFEEAVTCTLPGSPFGSPNSRYSVDYSNMAVISPVSSLGSSLYSRNGSVSGPTPSSAPGMYNNLDFLMCVNDRADDTGGNVIPELSHLKQALSGSFSTAPLGRPTGGSHESLDSDNEADGELFNIDEEDHPPSYAELVPLISPLLVPVETNDSVVTRTITLCQPMSSTLTLDAYGQSIDLIQESMQNHEIHSTGMYHSYR
ncbi:hypothetical protein BABINDRAFT_84617 [Babjeviella inositovora NRRL Y-12698]|uniref:Arrestin C-terminal-like domain-containing protein n=1 Tax=Babjeviella inositovora NRRL Y-12698 TaxID=984486 RepID=A0A1E3QLA6_9ASCO|nr:uncharacterized protein BABINDRAFT_84617 [Babjeviella inositovora NRRL Y-12698]ODQ78465.1 hypothetical protein BABINDRAFT_84617 [Babjeviella inositovora NRRL Y-12698]